MARNRKYQTTAVRYGAAAKAAVACVLIGGAGICYVWQKDQIARLGHRIKGNESQLAQLRDQNEKLRKQLATMRSPKFLEDCIRDMKLGLIAPPQTAVWRMPEPGRQGTTREFASQDRAVEDPRPAVDDFAAARDDFGEEPIVAGGWPTILKVDWSRACWARPAGDLAARHFTTARDAVG